MNQRGELEQQKFGIMKAARSAIRLKHSLAADEEINDFLPGLEKQIDAAIQSGARFELDVKSILEGS